MPQALAVGVDRQLASRKALCLSAAVAQAGRELDAMCLKIVHENVGIFIDASSKYVARM